MGIGSYDKETDSNASFYDRSVRGLIHYHMDKTAEG
jgi:hypothetical protein